MLEGAPEALPPRTMQQKQGSEGAEGMCRTTVQSLNPAGVSMISVNRSYFAGMHVVLACRSARALGRQCPHVVLTRLGISRVKTVTVCIYTDDMTVGDLCAGFSTEGAAWW